MATWQMYLPFLACEVKCGAAALDVADRQNAHSMTLAVRGTVELFRLVNAKRSFTGRYSPSQFPTILRQ
jgi:predicted nucleic acid-binding protein